jgi:hypothetical protein
VDITDTLSVVGNYVRNIADTVDVTDFIDYIKTGGESFFASISDTVDITDTLSTIQTYVRTIADAVDVTDTVSVIKIWPIQFQ